MTHPEGGVDPFGGDNGGAEIADALSKLLAEGGSLESFSQTGLPLKDPLIVYERIGETTDRKSIAIEQFIAQLDHLSIRDEPIEKAADFIPGSLRNFRGITAARLRERDALSIDAALVEGLTLQEIARYANQRYIEMSENLIQLSIGSPEHKQTLERAAFWSDMDTRISMAARLNKF